MPKREWDALMGISKEEFEKRRNRELSQPLNPKLGPTASRHTDDSAARTERLKAHSAKVRALLQKLAKRSGPAADALADKPGLTAAQVQHAIDRRRRGERR